MNRTRSSIILFFLLALAHPPVGLSQETQVRCPDGEGMITCADSQVAICRSSGDSIRHQCLTPPEGLVGLSLDLWLLSYILDDTITVTDESIEGYREIVRTGRWGSGPDSVFFAVPRNWQGTAQDKRR